MQSILNKRGSAVFYNKIWKKRTNVPTQNLTSTFLHSEIGSVYVRSFLVIKAFSNSFTKWFVVLSLDKINKSMNYFKNWHKICTQSVINLSYNIKKLKLPNKSLEFMEKIHMIMTIEGVESVWADCDSQVPGPRNVMNGTCYHAFFNMLKVTQL